VVKLKQTLFLNFILKKILRKKRENFEKFFFDDLVGSALCYHPGSFWSIYIALRPHKTSDQYPLKEIVGAVVIFDHGLKFGIIFLVSDHPAHKKLIASK
jgi:hypothetical protein